MKDVSKNNLINTEVLAYYKRCHMEVKICMLYSLGQSEVLLLLFLSNGQRVGSQWGDNMSSSGDKDVSSNPQSPKSWQSQHQGAHQKLPQSRAELFRKHYTNKTLLVKPYFSRYFHELISANNSILQNAHKQAGSRMGTFSWQFLFTLNHSKLIELLNKIIHNSKFIDIKVETLILNECTYTNRWWVEFKIAHIQF